MPNDSSAPTSGPNRSPQTFHSAAIHWPISSPNWARLPPSSMRSIDCFRLRHQLPQTLRSTGFLPARRHRRSVAIRLPNRRSSSRGDRKTIAAIHPGPGLELGRGEAPTWKIIDCAHRLKAAGYLAFAYKLMKRASKKRRRQKNISWRRRCSPRSTAILRTAARLFEKIAAAERGDVFARQELLAILPEVEPMASIADLSGRIGSFSDWPEEGVLPQSDGRGRGQFGRGILR